MKAICQFVFCLILSAVCDIAAANAINFSYTGSAGSAFLVNGTGSFTFADSPSSLALPDLQSFAFHLTINDTTAGTYTAVLDYSLADLLSFSASLSGANLLSIAFSTKPKLPTSVFIDPCDDCDPVPVSFALTSSGGAQGAVCFIFSDDDNPCVVTTGTIAVTAVPEPATAALLLLALSALALSRRSRSHEGAISATLARPNRAPILDVSLDARPRLRRCRSFLSPFRSVNADQMRNMPDRRIRDC